MNLAVITMTYNDSFKFKEWCRWYEEYKNDKNLHIIVDNGSEQQYLSQVKEYFKNSVIIERSSNGGCTAAYNDGIKVALKNNKIDAIALIGNDVRLGKDYLPTLYRFLKSNSQYGMVGGVVFKKDSKIVENYGDNMLFGFFPKSNFCKKNIEMLPASMKVSYVPGGINMASREFYEKVGLQDEKLFMYNDEMDMFYRARKVGLLEAVTKSAIAWHQHIANPIKIDMSSKMAKLNGRNRVYIAKKHMNFFSGFLMFTYMLLLETLVFVRDIRSEKSRRVYYSKWKGYIAGFKGDMNNDFINS